MTAADRDAAFREAQAVVRFERIGRDHAVPDMPIAGDPNDGENVAEQVHSFAERFLGSRFYETAVNEDDGRVVIEWGRFGSGRVIKPLRPEGGTQ